MSDAVLAAALREELIQVAAVAVAIVEDLDYGGTTNAIHTPRVLQEVRFERWRQEEKWGSQHHDPRAWLTILGEEFGEACQAALRLKHDKVREADALQ